MGIDFRNIHSTTKLYISYNFSDFEKKYGGAKSYINVTNRIAIAAIRYQLRLLAEDGFHPRIPNPDYGINWWWGVKYSNDLHYEPGFPGFRVDTVQLPERERRVVYATILKVHLDILMEELEECEHLLYVLKADDHYGNEDENSFESLLRIDAVRKIQHWWLYYYQLKKIREKYLFSSFYCNT